MRLGARSTAVTSSTNRSLAAHHTLLHRSVVPHLNPIGCLPDGQSSAAIVVSHTGQCDPVEHSCWKNNTSSLLPLLSPPHPDVHPTASTPIPSPSPASALYPQPQPQLQPQPQPQPQPHPPIPHSHTHTHKHTRTHIRAGIGTPALHSTTMRHAFSISSPTRSHSTLIHSPPLPPHS